MKIFTMPDRRGAIADHQAHWLDDGPSAPPMLDAAGR
jgi:hypothetical protein